jgi:glycosyltransferase involved in cell wall biosynthesis
MPKLSIITINYNNLEGLKRTVESVVNQTWQEFEYIVIDGGSTDGSKEYIESQNSKIDYWVSEKDSGIYNAMNKGIKAATGEYLLFLNSGDDFIDKDVLFSIKYNLEVEDIIYFDINLVDKERVYIKKCPDEMLFSFLFNDALPHQSTFIRKSLFDKIGNYDESFKIVSDWKFCLFAIFKSNASYKHIEGVFSNFYLDGLSSNVDFSNERKIVLQSYFKEFIEDYDELFKNRRELILLKNYQNTNRVKMLMEIEKSKIGKKTISVLFRILIILFCKKKINKILGASNNEYI